METDKQTLIALCNKFLHQVFVVVKTIVCIPEFNYRFANQPLNY
jgi:hypothetical protein